MIRGLIVILRAMNPRKSAFAACAKPWRSVTPGLLVGKTMPNDFTSISYLLPRKAMMHVSIALGGQATLCNDVNGEAAVIGGNRALP
jgi:hypothetical protein